MSTALAVLPMIWACEQQLHLVDTTRKQKPERIEPSLAFYRKYTQAMLRRYMRFSLEAARVPSTLRQEMFRSKVTSYRVHNFEDAVIFVHDVEKCLARLERTQQHLIKRIAVQEYTHEETAQILGMNRRTVVRRYDEAIDCLTAIFIDVNLLEPQKACQEARSSS